MKEFSIEEKAKRYDEAIEIAKEWYNDNQIGIGFKANLEKLFSELKESEDERIRKHLIGVVELYYGNTDEQEKKDCLAWLEKRAEQKHQYNSRPKYIGEEELLGEQKPADMVEPKFKVGDIMRTLEEAADGFTDGMPVVVSIDDEDYHCTNERIAIKDQDEYEYPPMNRKQESAEWSEEDEKNFKNISDLISDFYRPERASVLSTWFDGFKERVLSQPNKVWSDEDKKRVDQICEDLRCGMINFNAGKTIKGLHFEETIESNIAWLKELEERISLQPKQEWSEEDESRMENLCHFLKEYGNQYYGALTLEGTINWLKSLRPQNRWKPSNEHIDALSKTLKYFRMFNAEGETIERLTDLCEQLKKLKD